MRLNPEQKAVVEHIFGPAIVMAPAGSGKTALLARRVEGALAQGVSAKDILCLTFTNLAARQLRARVEATAPEHARDIWMGTFHGFCASVLHIEAKQTGLPGDFVIYDEEDCQDLLENIVRNEGFQNIGKPAEILAFFENAKSRSVGDGLRLDGYDGSDILTLSDDYVRDAFKRSDNIDFDRLKEVLPGLYVRYSKELIARHALDFSDLIYFVRAILAKVPKLRVKWSERFRFIQVDEVQDTHMAEYDVIRTLSSAGNIAVFGDLDQSIYGWRGATPLEVRDCFVRDFQPKVFTLPVNYRATRQLIRAADSFASRAFEQRFTSLVPDESCDEGSRVMVHHADSENAEAEWIADRIAELSHSANEFNNIAVFCRTNKKAQQVGGVLEKRRVPCVTVDQYQFFRRQEIKDALALLKLLLNPYDQSAAQRIALRYVEGAGEATVNRIVEDGGRIGVRLPDFFSSRTFIHDDPHGPLLTAYHDGKITVLDTETTGLSSVSDNIVELAYCVLDSGELRKESSTLVRSDKPVGSSVNVHGITDDDLDRDGMEPTEALAALMTDCAGSLLVGHNVPFDLGMIRSQAARLDIDFSGQNYADTYELARRFVDSRSYRLSDLSDMLQLRPNLAHRALGDVRTTASLLRHLIPKIAAGQFERREFVARYRKIFEPFAERFSAFRIEAERQRPADLLHSMLEELGVFGTYEDEDARTENLNCLVSIFEERDRVESPPAESLQSLVQFASLARNLDHLSENMDKVIVAPIHQSKGLEFRAVFIAGAVDGFIPIFNASDIEEEKRLFYVAMTRPKQLLYVTGSKVYGNYRKRMTPFLSHIDSALVERC